MGNKAVSKSPSSVFTEWFDELPIEIQSSGTLGFGLCPPGDMKPSVVERVCWLLLDEEPHAAEELVLPEFGGRKYLQALEVPRNRGVDIERIDDGSKIAYQFKGCEYPETTTKIRKGQEAVFLEFVLAIDAEHGHEGVRRILRHVSEALVAETDLRPWWESPGEAFWGEVSDATG